MDSIMIKKENTIEKKKKKGFTLVELIAVIAILAILGAIIVPKVSNYTTSATKSKNLANAKTIAQAIEMYNTDKATSPITETTTLATAKPLLMPASGNKYLQSWPTDDELAIITPATAAPKPVTTASTYGALLQFIEDNK